LSSGKISARYLGEAGVTALPPTLAEYTSRVVTPILERHKQGGAIAEKFEAAYLRSLEFDAADAAQARSRCTVRAHRPTPITRCCRTTCSAISRWNAARLGMAVHLHTAAGAGGYFAVSGANPLHLEGLPQRSHAAQDKVRHGARRMALYKGDYAAAGEA